jgi:hypothetical protein
LVESTLASEETSLLLIIFLKDRVAGRVRSWSNLERTIGFIDADEVIFTS